MAAEILCGPKAVAAALLAAQQRKQRVLQKPDNMTPTIKRAWKRAPHEKATPMESATPTPTPGMKHAKAEADHEAGMPKKALFAENDEFEEGTSHLAASITWP